MEAHQRLADSRDSERLSLAQELHDRPLQALYGIRLGLAALTTTLPAGPAQEAGDRQQQALNDVVGQLRAICQDLRPPALMSFGLEVAIRAYAERFVVDYPDLTLDLDLAADGRILAERTRVGLYRILQHALGNVARHADASYISVRLTLSPTHVTMQIRDDGVGFDVPASWLELGRQGHMGLMGASERAAAIGGTFTVDSAPGEGTLVRVVAPLAPPTPARLTDAVADGHVVTDALAGR
jgi:signal transduction histidine kinase